MTILDEIVEHKRREVAARKKSLPFSALPEQQYFRRKPVSLRSSLLRHIPFGIIAEIKRSSPSAGAIKQGADPAAIAAEYDQAGAAAISLLTDERYFGGCIEDLPAVRKATALPILRKEFIIDLYQVFEAKAFGADAILLIAGILERSHLAELNACARILGLETLVEIYDIQELEKIDSSYMPLIGVNNRNLRTMKVDINHTSSVAAHLPATTTIVSESGISSPADLRLLLEHNIRAALIGEHLMKAGNPGLALRALLEGVQS